MQFETPQIFLAKRDEIKRERDEIDDDVYRLVLVFDPGSDGTRNAVAINQRYNQPNRPPPPDFLPMRNSLVNTLYVDSRWMPVAGMQVANSFKYLLNRKLELAAAGQAAETLHNFSLVSKASYTRQLAPRLSATGRVKHLLARWDEGSYVPIDTLGTNQFLQPVDGAAVAFDTVAVPEAAASWSLITPELIVSYALTPKTRLEFGQHGFFFAPFKGRLIDREVEANSYTQNISLLQLTMEGAYGGYRMVSSLGLRRENIDMDRHSLVPDTDLTSFFVDVIFSPE